MASAQGATPVDEAISRCNEFHELVQASPRATVWILHPLALLHAMREDVEGAGVLLGEADRDTRGARRAELGLLAPGGVGAPVHGSAEIAEARLRADVDTLASMSGKGTLATTFALLAKAVLAQQRLDEAAELCAAAEREAAAEDTMTQVIWRGVQARVAAHDGRPEAGETLARAAVTLADSTSLISLRGDAMLELANVLQALDRREEAARAAQAGLALYNAKGNAAAAREALRLLRL